MKQQMQLFRRLGAATLTTVGLVLAGVAPAVAQAPHNWQLGFQPAHSPTQQAIQGVHDLILWLIAVVTFFVAGLLVYCLWAYRASKNPKPSRVSHHTALEVAWTLAPVLILVVIAIPSFRVVYFQDRAVNPDMTIKVTAHQWYWEYTYPDHDNIRFDSYMLAEDSLQPGQLRNLDVDNQVVVPAGKSVRILTTSADVIHSFFVPSLGVQRYAIPGRTIETWMKVNQPGTYYGQCNQICGTNHAVMPIAVRALPEAEFQAWIAEAKTKFAAGGTGFPVAEKRRLTAVAE